MYSSYPEREQVRTKFKVMRLIIEPDYDRMSKWAANYVAKCINEANPTADKPFKLGCPTGSSPLGMYRELIAMNSNPPYERKALLG